MAILHHLLTKEELKKLDAAKLAKLEALLEKEMTKTGFARLQKSAVRTQLLPEIQKLIR